MEDGECVDDLRNRIGRNSRTRSRTREGSRRSDGGYQTGTGQGRKSETPRRRTTSPRRRSKTPRRRRDRRDSRDRYRSESRGRSATPPRRRRRSNTPPRYRSLSRSVSGELYTRGEDQVKRFTEIIEDQQSTIISLLSEHKAEIDSKLGQKQRRFQSKQIEKQFEVNSEFRALAVKIKSCLTNNELSRAETNADKLIELLDRHEEDLIIADVSPHGWLAVAKIRGTKELPKTIRRRLEQVDRELAQQRQQNGQARRRGGRFPREGQDTFVRRPDKRFSPEELLHNATRQVRSGTCSHCKKSYHFYKECPLLWSQVQESREAKAKADATN